MIVGLRATGGTSGGSVNLALLLIGAMGFSRIYLGVHYVSDVLAGVVLGALWAGVVGLAGTWHVSIRRGQRATDC